MAEALNYALIVYSISNEDLDLIRDDDTYPDMLALLLDHLEHPEIERDYRWLTAVALH